MKAKKKAGERMLARLFGCFGASFLAAAKNSYSIYFEKPAVSSHEEGEPFHCVYDFFWRQGLSINIALPNFFFDGACDDVPVIHRPFARRGDFHGNHGVSFFVGVREMNLRYYISTFNTILSIVIQNPRKCLLFPEVSLGLVGT
jgi:hypothetical protein